MVRQVEGRLPGLSRRRALTLSGVARAHPRRPPYLLRRHPRGLDGLGDALVLALELGCVFRRSSAQGLDARGCELLDDLGLLDDRGHFARDLLQDRWRRAG